MGIKFRALDAIFRFLASTTQEDTLEEAGIDVEGHDPRLHTAHISPWLYPHWKPEVLWDLVNPV